VKVGILVGADVESMAITTSAEEVKVAEADIMWEVCVRMAVPVMEAVL
jgi:hypothetical protein